MNIICSEFYKVNIGKNIIEKKAPEGEFKAYIETLINSVIADKSTRQYKIRTNTTEVISSIFNIVRNIKNGNMEEISTDILCIVNRLLRSEIELQQQIGAMGQAVRSGNLLVSIIKKEGSEEIYQCIISKVEDNGFYDSDDLKQKYGFSSEKLKIWRSTVIEVEVDEETGSLEIGDIYVCLDKHVTYWNNTFLEIDPKLDDETNTERAYKYTELKLKRNLKKQAPADYTTLKYHLVGIMKRSGLIKYKDVINSIFDGYVPTQTTSSKLNALKEELLKLPEEKEFDNEFNSIPSCISARLKSIYKITTGISLKVDLDAGDNIQEKIISETSDDDLRYIKIRVTDDETYKAFIRDRT